VNVKRSALLTLAAALLCSCREPKSLVNTAPVNLPAEIERARAEHKLLLLEFGSSDSCPPCIAFERKVFSTSEFDAYAESNLVFVRLDFPFRAELPPATQATNDSLARQFDVPAFPTFIALDSHGKEYWRMPAKNDPEPRLDQRLFDPKNFIEMIDSVKQKRL
jgi:protein disulfide-isomerase